MEYKILFGFVRGSRGDTIEVEDQETADQLVACGLIEAAGGSSAGAGEEPDAGPATTGRSRKPRGG